MKITTFYESIFSCTHKKSNKMIHKIDALQPPFQHIKKTCRGTATGRCLYFRVEACGLPVFTLELWHTTDQGVDRLQILLIRLGIMKR
jgi:hypothetical protein